MLEGYNSRVDAIRGDIKALFNLKRWDKDDCHGDSVIILEVYVRLPTRFQVHDV